jgi:hypothetical protein
MNRKSTGKSHSLFGTLEQVPSSRRGGSFSFLDCFKNDCFCTVLVTKDIKSHCNTSTLSGGFKKPCCLLFWKKVPGSLPFGQISLENLLVRMRAYKGCSTAPNPRFSTFFRCRRHENAPEFSLAAACGAHESRLGRLRHTTFIFCCQTGRNSAERLEPRVVPYVIAMKMYAPHDLSASSSSFLAFEP